MVFPMSDPFVKQQQNTAAYYVQAVVSFGLALLAVTVGIYKLDASAWVRAFLAVAVLYLTTSAFTLAKVVRDRQDSGTRPL